MDAAFDNRPQLAARLLRRALTMVPADGDAPVPYRTLRCRILVSLAYPVAELGSVEAGMVLLEEAGKAAAGLDDHLLHGVLRNQRGLLQLRAGRLRAALTHLNGAAPLLAAAGAAAELSRSLMNRGLVHLELQDPTRAGADFERAADVAAGSGLTVTAAKARYNLGYALLIAGDLPRALREMDAVRGDLVEAEPAAGGICALDRARVLLAAGLITEADRELAEAIEHFRRYRAGRDQAEAELTRAQVALADDRARDAAALARSARARFRRRGNRLWALLADLALLQADVLSGRRSPTRAVTAVQLAKQLRVAGLKEDARAAALLAARLDPTGDPDRGGAAGRLRSSDRIGTRLLVRLVRAEQAGLSQAPARRQAELRRALADLQGYRARLGSLDLQTATALHGRQLVDIALRDALADGRPSVVHAWIERTRGLSLLLPPVRPPEDSRAAELLAELRAVDVAYRAAELGGRPDPELAARRVQLRQAVRHRSFHTDGPGAELAPARPVALDAVQDAVAGADGTLVSFVGTSGLLSALVVTRRSARVVPVGPSGAIVDVLRRVRADLDALALSVVSERIRESVRASLGAGLRRLGELLWEPVTRYVDRGPVAVTPIGQLVAVPWTCIPGLRGRPVAVVPSATWWQARRARAVVPADTHPVLAAGPGLLRAETEVHAAASCWTAGTTLTGPAATADAVLDAAAGSALLHLAAHGRYEPDNPLFSAVDLADGPLFGYDLDRAVALPAHVVLSACDLGLAAVRPGGEALGITSALLHQGAVSVVAGVARVGDAVSCEAMVGHHRHLRSGLTPAEALARALGDIGADVPDRPAPFVALGAAW